MATKVAGNITIGLILGLLQFVSTFAITMIYARWADREFRPGRRGPRRTHGEGDAVVTTLVPMATTQVGNTTLNIVIFALFVVVTLTIVIRVSRQNQTAADYYAGGRAFTGRQNGIAITGDYLGRVLPRHRRRHRGQRI